MQFNEAALHPLNFTPRLTVYFVKYFKIILIKIRRIVFLQLYYFRLI